MVLREKVVRAWNAMTPVRILLNQEKNFNLCSFGTKRRARLQSAEPRLGTSAASCCAICSGSQSNSWDA
jgi:hypothetical protein